MNKDECYEGMRVIYNNALMAEPRLAGEHGVVVQLRPLGAYVKFDDCPIKSYGGRYYDYHASYECLDAEDLLPVQPISFDDLIDGVVLTEV